MKRTSSFYKEVAWLSQSGMTTGYADGAFNPKSNVDREAVAAFLHRGNTKFVTEMSRFLNERTTTSYADGSFRPYSPVTREATAAFLQRMSR